MSAAIGMSMTTAARSRSLTTMTCFWSQRSTNVPAIGPRMRFGIVAATNTKRDRDRRAGQRVDEEREGDLVHPVAEQADQLAGPERREVAVEGEPDVRVAAGPLDEHRARPRRELAGRRDRGARRRGRAVAADAGRASEARARRGRDEPVCRWTPPATPAAAGETGRGSLVLADQPGRAVGRLGRWRLDVLGRARLGEVGRRSRTGRTRGRPRGTRRRSRRRSGRSGAGSG